MKIVLAKTAGFCEGVRRAVEVAFDVASNYKTIYKNSVYTYGPLIHNPQILSLLKQKGVSVLKDIPAQGKGIIIIRAHGISPYDRKRLEDSGFDVIDATCPRVIKVHNIILRHKAKGYTSIIVGDNNHPEVIGLLGCAGRNGYVIESIKEFNSLPKFDKAVIIAQTTQNKFIFDKIVKHAKKAFPNYKIFDTICNSTEKRQEEIKRISDEVDATVIVGSHSSGNTCRLAQVAADAKKPSFHIENEFEIDFGLLASAKTIGVTAGASTPNWVIKNVCRALETNLSYPDGRQLYDILFKTLRFLLLSNIYLAFGAGMLCFACCALLGVSNYVPYVIMASMYIFSMHTVNNLKSSDYDIYNNPEKAEYYIKNKTILWSATVLADIVGIAAGYYAGVLPFFLVLLMSVIGLFYDSDIIPKFFFRFNYKKIKDIPASKTLLITIAWGIFTAIIPWLTSYSTVGFAGLIVFIWSSGTVFARTASLDILDIQGDIIIGKETVPTLLGKKKTVKLIRTVLVCLFFLLALSGLFFFPFMLTLSLSFIPVSMLIILRLYYKSRQTACLRLKFIIESHFVIAGIIAFIWL